MTTPHTYGGFQNPTLPLAEPQRTSGDSRQLRTTPINGVPTEGLEAGNEMHEAACPQDCRGSSAGGSGRD